jgi:hypothetical protein
MQRALQLMPCSLAVYFPTSPSGNKILGDQLSLDLCERPACGFLQGLGSTVLIEPGGYNPASFVAREKDWTLMETKGFTAIS